MYLVTGASGQLVIENLLRTHKIPAAKIIATTRDPQKLAALSAQGVDVRAADFDRTDSLVAAFKGATRRLIISTDAMDRPGRRLEQHRNAIAASEKAGVAHVLYTSMPKPETSAVLFAPDHLGTEKALAGSSLKGWTVLRNNWYFENLFFSVPQALKSGSWYSAAGQGKLAHVGRADQARAAAAALASNDNGKTTYTITGTKEYTTDEIAKLVSTATGKPLTVVHVPVERLIQGMVGAGLPEPMAKLFASFDANTAQGGLSGITGDIKKLTGTEPGAFEDWLKENAKALAA